MGGEEGAGGPGRRDTREGLLPGVAVSAALLYAVVFFAGHFWIRAADRRAFPEGAFNPGKLAADAATGAAAAAGVIALSLAAERLFSWARRLEDEFRKLLGGMTLPEVLVISALSGLAEEYFFRGAMQPAVGIVFASIAFGLLHVGPGRVFIPWTVFATGMGFLLGWLFELTGSLTAPVAAHFIVNAVNLTRISRVRPAGGMKLP